jgi:hypothetical protein
MNATAFVTAARAVGLALVILAAAASGLVVGNALQGLAGTNAGYPPGWQGGAAAPMARTADAVFSIDAISAVRAARGDARVAGYADYGIRHLVVAEKNDAPAQSLTNPTPR